MLPPETSDARRQNRHQEVECRAQIDLGEAVKSKINFLARV